MNFEDLTEEQKAKARECKTPEELMQLAMDEDLDLTEEQLEKVSGGGNAWEDFDCPRLEFN